MTVLSKICGISSLGAANVAAQGGADYLGFIHFAKSPRHLTLESMAQLMHAIREEGILTPLVCVVVNPDDELLRTITDSVRPDMIQLHGHETPERTAEVRRRFGLPVIKAISVETARDIAAAAAYDTEHLLFDAKTPKDAALPGGLGISFDWSLMRSWRGSRPWFLAGGLTSENIADALQLSAASMVDVSSGVESSPGVKDEELISVFLKTVKSL
ncbi:phosphoribosylanthranilate isomerase [Asticcacaulis sp. AC402]|uniref:phosphoribosylanthranilate isomerase n=1 Tax=Asticcacaulis sp. AC402 TaxID=1282361 RepID=UPI0003C3E1FD|nr:phosphoribosylanthranilate isomerase [Asticcacaulis sp. AC402]ESQ75812.1 hypothetical protein ABAC402_07545 [Asticcacaulis sp. AC402]